MLSMLTKYTGYFYKAKEEAVSLEVRKKYEVTANQKEVLSLNISTAQVTIISEDREDIVCQCELYRGGETDMDIDTNRNTRIFSIRERYVEDTVEIEGVSYKQDIKQLLALRPKMKLWIPLKVVLEMDITGGAQVDAKGILANVKCNASLAAKVKLPKVVSLEASVDGAAKLSIDALAGPENVKTSGAGTFHNANKNMIG